MSKKAREYSSEEKAKVALEALKGELTMAQISSKYGVHATQINRWRKEALASMVSGFKSKIKDDANQEDLIKQLYEQIGQLTVGGTGSKKNLLSLVKDKRSLIDKEHKRLSIKRQCELLGLNRSSYYFKPKGFSPEDYAIMRRMDEIFTEHPY
jgi:transposase-like protein